MTKTVLHFSKPVIIFCIATAILLAADILTAGGGSHEFESVWRSDEIIIDGDSGDWNDRTFYLEDIKGVVNVCNDAEHLYLCLLSADRDVMRQMMMSGMTIWFDCKNKKNKSFGFRFKVGMGDRPEGSENFQTDANPGRRSGPSPQSGQIDEAEIQKRFAVRMEQMSSFEILCPDSSTRVIQMTDSIGAVESPGVEVKTGFSNGAFMYEFKVPLGRNDGHQYGIGSSPGGVIAIGFDSPEIDRRQMIGERKGPGGGRGMPPDGGGMGGGGRGGRGGGMEQRPGRGGGRGGGGRGGGMEQRPGRDNITMPEPFEVWLSVKLAGKE